MNAIININLTAELTQTTIEGPGKECVVLLVEFFNSNPEVKHLFKTALDVERHYALEQEMETWKEAVQKAEQ